MATSPFQAALRALRSPLAFAARDDYAGADVVRDLERTVRQAALAAASLAIPPDARAALEGVARAFAKPLEGGARREAVRRALERLAPLAAPDFADSALARSPAALPGLGPKRADALARRGLATIVDLLFHLPTRYDDRRALGRIADLVVGQRATFVAAVRSSGFAYRGGRHGRIFQALVSDASGSVELTWFRGGEAISKVVRPGALLLVTGDVTRYRFSKQLVHPEVDRIGEAGEGQEPAAARGAQERSAAGEAPDPGAARGGASPAAAPPRRVVPEYSTPEGLHPRALRRAVERAVADYADLVAGFLPPQIARARALPEPAQALRQLHQPAADGDAADLVARTAAAHARLVLEELFLLEVGLALRREGREQVPGLPIDRAAERAASASAALPFALTGAQRRVTREILADLARPHPMSRLLEGDVGCGKTVVAYLAAAAVAGSGHQTALMAPTEVLAEQHARTLEGLARATGGRARVRVALLSASQPRPAADAVRAALAAGEVDLVVGTHALLQESVGFHSLGLVVVDEQHRFGVLQRAALAAKASDCQPHTLVMTATPIPRTLALTVHGDLDLSVIDELPPGREPVRTLLLREGEGRRVVELLRETVARGEQVYVVYPLVEESEKVDLRAVTASAERIARAFPDLRVDLVHGRLSADERGAAMRRFEGGETQVLVCTTVIEVGVDVPGATLVVIEHAERFGLAQLHQLRGRVGRGSRPGTCALVARGVTEGSEARLAAMLETTDGFAIAEADLRIRGPGEFLGTRQHGRLPDLRIADLVRDARHVAVAREAALEVVRGDPRLRRSPELLRAVRARWGARLALADVG